MIEGKISGVYICRKKAHESEEVDSISAQLDGIDLDIHAGFSRLSGSRDKGYIYGTEIRNDRQWSAISIEELLVIARLLKIATLEPNWLSANLAVSNIYNFSQIPRGSRFVFSGGVVLVVESQNQPCITPGIIISQKLPETNSVISDFPKSAIQKRGLLGVIEKAGVIRSGEVFEVRFPRK